MFQKVTFFILQKNILKLVKLKMLHRNFVLIVLLFTFSACTRIIYLNSAQVKDNEYDSEFPVLPTTKYLEDINNSVKQVNVIAGYYVYDFSIDSKLKKEDLDEDNIEKIAVNKTYLNSPASGTATIIYNDNHKLALLSCAHIFNFPDTVIINHLDEKGNVTPFIQSIYFKTKETISVPELPESNDFKIIAGNNDKDIIVIGKKYLGSNIVKYKPFNYPEGKAGELKEGDFVYLFGFPRGERMVSTAIVGEANRDKNYGFIIDASVHTGVSGGPVFAIRDGIPNFELVGMVYAIAGEMLQFLGPDTHRAYEPDNQNKYTGDIYLKSTRQIIYGITYVIAIETIEDFFKENRNIFLENGFDSDLFLKKK